MISSHHSEDSESRLLASASSTLSFLHEPTCHDSDISKSTGRGSVRSKSTRINSASSRSTVLDVELDKRPTRRDRHHLMQDHVQRLRSKVIQSRLELRERRAGLREQHGLVAEYFVRLYKTLQSYWNSGGNVRDSDIDKVNEGLYEARDKLGPMEEDYNDAEDDLDLLEYELDTQEKKLYRQSIDIRSVAVSNSSTSSLSSGRTQHQSLRGVLDDAAEEISPRGRYLARLGDANIIRERLHNLIVEQNECCEQEQRRKSRALPPYPPNVAFLANFPLAYGQLMKELHEVEGDLRRLNDEARTNLDDGREIAPATNTSTVSISQDQSGIYANGTLSCQSTMRKEDLNYVASETTPRSQRHSISRATTYPFTSRSTPSFKKDPPRDFKARCGEKLLKPEEPYIMHTPAESREDISQLSQDRFQAPNFRYIAQGSVSSVPMWLSSPSRTSVPLQSNTEPTRRKRAVDQGKHGTAFERISQWILDRLRGSKLEELRHKAFLDGVFLDDGDWLVYVEQYWPQDEAGRTLGPNSASSRSSFPQHSSQVEVPLYSSSSQQKPAAAMSTPSSVYPTTNYKSAFSDLKHPTDLIISRSV